MKRREFLTLVGVASALPLAARAQQAQRMRRIGLLLPPPRNLEVDAFLKGLSDLGWVNGVNVHVEYRDAGGDDARLPALANELVALDVDVLVTATFPGILAAHNATTKIPTVMIVGPDLVTIGLAASMAHPGGNITGQTFFLTELAAKRLEILAGLAPSTRRVGVLVQRGNPLNNATMSTMRNAAQALKMELLPIEVDVPGDLESALSLVGSTPMDGLVITDANAFVTNTSMVAAIVDKCRVPSVAAPIVASRGAALMGYGVDFTAMFRHAAVFVDKILKGANPAEIPIEQPTQFKTVINHKTAKALGVEIPPSLLVRADDVIE
ncbi:MULTISPECIES: ABC transporter substrate-binding protein [unclassified Bradyrhizobium]|uniref:ABC transporter substrate-binding protein n=1 Tax=unclassified Bradyrhizobium TaxID=2631580 RepID=UPI002449BB46|nr:MULTISPECIES: ABC transporter substrate-binding protein [unclassified Bradyrhizobium]MDH2346848.1 ABC transporter substrate-binding protein [Bradyrhizobium sp. SSUT77]MDH2355469.1 ABC transporter substrate-binding protein [Bradyrhizobium sp. SSUT112]